MRPPGPGGAEGRACGSPAEVVRGGGGGWGGRPPARCRACVGGGRGEWGGACGPLAMPPVGRGGGGRHGSRGPGGQPSAGGSRPSPAPLYRELSAGPTPLGSALSPLRMACQTKGHGRNSHAYPGGRGVQTLEHTDTAETRVQVGLRAIGRLIGRSASRSGLNTASVRVNTRGGSTASGRFRDLRVCLLRVGQGVYCLCVFSQRSRRYGALFGHSASQAGLASTHGSPNTAVPALRCPSWAFGEPSWTCYTPLTTHHSSPGVTVSILGIRRAKLDVLHATDHPSQQSRRYGVHLGHSASQAGRATRH